MASIYYLYDDAVHVEEDIVQKYTQQDENIKENHFAAITIQRSWRGYVVRKNLSIKRNAATVLQKYIRGWLTRYHWPDKLQEHFDRTCLKVYNKMATRIQANWKGILVRKEICVKQILKDKRKAKQEADDLMVEDDMSEHLDDTEEHTLENTKDRNKGDLPKVYVKRTVLDKIYIEKMLQLLFDRHHLLSTSVTKGVFSDNNKSELSQIEKVLKSLPWTDYMKKIRKIYNKYYQESANRKPTYMFSDKKLQKQEDLLRLKDRRNERKDIAIADYIGNNEKPFVLNSTLEKSSYERYLFRQGEYILPETEIVRTEDKSKNIAKKDFELTLKKIVKESNVPPYYADFWYKQCVAHNILNL